MSSVAACGVSCLPGKLIGNTVCREESVQGELGGGQSLALELYWLLAAQANRSFKKHEFHDIFPYKLFSMPLRSILDIDTEPSRK